MNALETLRTHYEDRTRAARAWAAAGGKVVGYLCDNVPDELISAAGFFPLRVSGDPASGVDLTRALVDRLYPPDVTNRPPFVDSILNELLRGAYDVLDYLIVPHNRHAIQAIFRELQDAKACEPSLRIPELHYLDKAWAPYFSAEVYNRDRILELRRVLEDWSGRKITDEALSEAIASANENRRLLGEVASLRAQDPPRISGADALRIIGTSMLMPKTEHNRLLRELLSEASSWRGRAGPRLYVGGSPIDHTRVYETIEACGATVVAEDHCWGNRAFELPVEGDDPILALAARFHRKPACSIIFPVSETRTACARRAALARADAAIFYVMNQDWTQNWETPGQVKALVADGRPSLHLSAQSYDLSDPAPLSAAVAKFLAELSPNRPVLEATA